MDLYLYTYPRLAPWTCIYNHIHASPHGPVFIYISTPRPTDLYLYTYPRLALWAAGAGPYQVENNNRQNRVAFTTAAFIGES